MTRRMTRTYSEQWRDRMAEKEAKEAATDYGALEPCGFCGGRHVPGECPTGLDKAED